MRLSLSEPLPIDGNDGFRVYPQRFWILFIFVLLSFNQCMFWLTFSPIINFTKEYYHVSESVVDLLLNWGPIIFLPTLPIAYFILNMHHGLRKSMILFAIICFISTVVRLIPLLITSPSKDDFHDVNLPFLHLGQILNGAAGPFAMALPSQLSCIWFAPHERARATTVAVLGVSLGSAVAFLISPYLVFEAWRVPHLLYLHAGQGLLGCILTLAYFPAEPPTPPSAAAEKLLSKGPNVEHPIEQLKRFMRDILKCCRDRSCVLLILAGAILNGTLGAWTGLFASILTPLGYTEPQAGWFGFAETISIIVGALLVGSLADRPRFQRSLKMLMLVVLIISFLFCGIFQLSVRTVLWPEHAPIPSNVVSIGSLLSLIGLFGGAGSPLIYECLAEMMHPLPESLTASIYVQLFNVVTLIFVAIAPNRYKLMNLLVLLLMGIAIIMIACARVTYKRRDGEKHREITLPQGEAELRSI